MFGWTLIRKEDLKEFERRYFISARASECHRWFSGWKDLDVIWDYLLYQKSFGIERARMEYARLRGTDEYGNNPTPNREAGE